MPRRPRKTRRLASAGWRIALVVTALAAAIAGSATPGQTATLAFGSAPGQALSVSTVRFPFV